MAGDLAERGSGQLEAFVGMLRHLREPLLIASPSGTIVASNAAGADALGTSAAALEGASLVDYAVDPDGLHDRLNGAHPEATVALKARDGRRFVCDASALAPGFLLLRLSGGPDAALRARSFVAALTDPASLDREGPSRLERLHAFTRTLARAITLAQVTEAVVDMGLAATAARGGGLWLLSSDGSLASLVRAVGVGGPRPEHYVEVPIEGPMRMPILDAIRSGSPVWIESCAEMEQRYPEAYRAFSRGGESALACLPLFAQGRCIGGFTYNYAGARRFVDEERAFLQVLAWHSAQAIERSRLYAAERSAREGAEASHRRTEFLADAGALLASSLDYASTLAGVACAAVPRVADWCVVEFEEERLRGGPALAAHVDPSKLPWVHELSRRFRALGDLKFGIPAVLRSGKPELCRSISEERLRQLGDPELVEVFGKIGFVSSMAVPISARGRTLGAILLGSADPTRVYDEADLAMGEDLGRRAGLAVDNARLYRDARDADRQKDEFLATLSHELRNPLAPIVTALDVMKLRGGDVFANERAVLARHVRHIVRLVDDLLDIAGLARGKIQLEKEIGEVSPLISKAVEMVRPLVAERAQRLTISAPLQGLAVLADPARLAQAIANLLSNASKYTAAGGEITVTALTDDSDAIIRVRDSGIGIAPHALSRIFDLFVQEAPVHDGARGGLGIGLSVVKKVVGLHGGFVSAHSDGLGRGSEFVIRLPLAFLDPIVDAIPAGGSSGAPGLERVLLVDDNVDAATMIGEALEVLGYSVRIAHDGPSALVAAQAFKPDVALVDIGLPIMSGYELVGRLRELDSAPRTIVAVTGFGQPRDFVRSREAGFDEHIVKPVSFETLCELLERSRGLSHRPGAAR